MSSTVIDIVRALCPSAHTNYVGAFVNGDQLLWRHGVTTPLRVSHFLAQAMHETGGFTILEENLSYSAVRITQVFGVGKHSAAVTAGEAATLARNSHGLAERVYGVGNPRKSKELGNLNPGDGYLYRGRGIMQTTGRINYRRLGQRATIDFESNPHWVAEAKYALVPALLEWTQGSLNDYADLNDIEHITKRINGGYNGFADRKTWFNRVWEHARHGVVVNGTEAVVASGNAWEVGQRDEKVAELQRTLIELGIDKTLAVDGKMGPRTRAALRQFQMLAQIPADGIYGPVTAAALQIRLETLRA